MKSSRTTWQSIFFLYCSEPGSYSRWAKPWLHLNVKFLNAASLMAGKTAVFAVSLKWQCPWPGLGSIASPLWVTKVWPGWSDKLACWWPLQEEPWPHLLTVFKSVLSNGVTHGCIWEPDLDLMTRGMSLCLNVHMSKSGLVISVTSQKVPAGHDAVTSSE